MLTNTINGSIIINVGVVRIELYARGVVLKRKRMTLNREAIDSDKPGS